MSAISDEMLAGLQEFCDMLAEHNDDPPSWDVWDEEASAVSGRGNREQWLRVARREGKNRLDAPNSGDNTNRRVPRRDRYKNRRKGR